MRNEAIGLSIEGTDVKVAHIALSHKGVILKRLDIAQLPAPLGVPLTEEEQEKESMDAFQEAFGEIAEVGAPVDERAEDEGDEEEEDASSALLGILSGYNLRKAKIGVNLPEDSVSYYLLSDTFAVKGRKLKRALMELVAPKHERSLSPDMINYVKAADKNLLCMVCDQEPAFLDTLKELKRFLGRNKPYIGLIDSVETALMSLVRANHQVAPGEITALIYVCADSSRVSIMKGAEYMRLLPPIQEGASSPDFGKTIYSKILFEQDEGGLPDIDRVILAGDLDVPSAIEFFSEKFPKAKVETIKYGKFIGTEMEPSKIPAPLSSFALPLALARKSLEPTNPRYYHTDFTPDYLKEAQKPFKIAWHGLLSLVVIFAMSLLLVIKGGYNYVEMQDLKEDTYNHNRLTKLAQPLLHEIDMLNEKISLYESEMKQLASLAQDSHLWSDSLLKLCDLAERCDSLWFTSIKSSENRGYLITGKSRTRDKITALASAFENSYLDTVARGKIRDYGVWDFVLRVRFPDALQPETYLAMVKEHSKDGLGFKAERQVVSRPGSTFVATPNLAMTASQRQPGLAQGLLGAPLSAGMQGPDIFGAMLRVGFDSYLAQSERIANSPRFRRLRAEQESSEALVKKLWEQRRFQREQKLAAAERSLDEKYRGPKAKASPASEVLGPFPDRDVRSKPAAKVEESKKKARKMVPKEKAKSLPAPRAKAKGAGKDGQPAKKEEGRQDKPAKATVQATTQPTPRAAADYDRALELFRSGDYRRSAALFNRILATNKQSAMSCNVHYWLGHCLYSMGNFEGAVAEFEQSKRCEDKSLADGVLFMLGNCLLKLGDSKRAGDEYAQLLRDYPDSRFGPIAQARARTLSQP